MQVRETTVTELDSAADLETTGGGGTTPPPPAPVRKPRRKGLSWTTRLEIALLAGPALVIFLAFVIFPVVVAGYYGFFSWQGYGPAVDFVGLRNYITIL